VKLGLIFDLDGTLIDSLQGIAASLNHALTEAGLPTHSLTAVKGFIGNGAKILIQRAAPAEASAGLLDQLEESFKSDYDRTWPQGTAIYAGIAALLESLHQQGYPLAVLSNKPHAFTTAIVARLFPSIPFSAVLGQQAGVPHKPDPAGALEIARALQRTPAECLIIGDSVMDLETAHHAGMRSIAVTWGFQDRARLAAADFMADDPASLRDQILLHNLAGAGAGVRPELAAWVNGGVDAGVDVVADDGTKLAATGVDELAADL
jgi:phosphoglycolate phosphatase